MFHCDSCDDRVMISNVHEAKSKSQVLSRRFDQDFLKVVETLISFVNLPVLDQSNRNLHRSIRNCLLLSQVLVLEYKVACPM
jgi:hypothetical protein